MPIFRADHIGSLYRPAALLRAREELEARRIDAVALRAAEDAAIRDAVALQEEVGLPVITDGEFRRHTYSDSFTTAGLSGVVVALTEDEGWRPSDAHGHRMARRIPKVTGRIAWRSGNAADFAFLRGATSRTAKITLPGPAYIHYRTGREHISRDAYPDLDAFWSDLVAAYHQELRSLAAAGCRYLQIDETALVKLGDPRVRQLLRDRGDDWQDLLRIYVDAINAVVAAAPPEMKIAIHVCRSQDPSWQADTGYDPIADALFNRIAIDTYLLEYDNPRSGTFEPLRLLPKGKQVVLGLVASRSETLETADLLKRRIEEAARYVSLDQLGLSPHCGFSTSARPADETAMRLQRAKLKLVVDVAREMWGG